MEAISAETLKSEALTKFAPAALGFLVAPLCLAHTVKPVPVQEISQFGITSVVCDDEEETEEAKAAFPVAEHRTRFVYAPFP